MLLQPMSLANGKGEHHMVRNLRTELGESPTIGGLRRLTLVQGSSLTGGQPARKSVSELNDAVNRLCRRIREIAVHPLVLAYRASRQADTIRADVARWRESIQLPGRAVGDAPYGESALRAYLASVPEFRNLFYYRLKTGGGWPTTLALVGRRIWRPLSTFDIYCPSVGPGLVIAHGHVAGLTAERVGANCTIHQEVTVGWRTNHRHGRVSAGTARPPILGDNVFLGAGAKVLGEITIW